jgi:adenylate kinase family enzyme
MSYTKIYILGSVASGKTTIARELSKRWDIPCFELDNVVHVKQAGGDIKRSPEERDLEFSKIINSEKWIIEGVFRKCFNEGFPKAEIIILLDTPSFKRNYRIAKRWICQKLKLEKSNYRPTLKMLFLMYKWSNDFERTKDDILKILAPYKEKLIIMGDNTKYEQNRFLTNQ